MISDTGGYGSLAAGIAAFNALGAGFGPDTQQRVSAVLVAVGLLLTVVFVVRHLRRHGPAPFAGTPPRATRLTPLLMVLPLLIYVFSGLFLTVLRETLAPAQPEGLLAVPLACNSLAQIAGAGCCLWIAHGAFRGGMRGMLLGRTSLGSPLLSAACCILPAAVLCEGTAFLTKLVALHFDPACQFVEHRVLEALHDPAEPAWGVVVLWLGAVVVAPVAEECFFRGIMQSTLVRQFHSRTLAVLLTGLAFGCVHADQWHVVPALTLFGWILGLQYERQGGIAAPIATHALFNLKTLIWYTLTTGPAG